MRPFAVTTAILLLISACTDAPTPPGDRQSEPEPDPVEVWIDAPEEGTEIGGREVLVRARATAEAGLSEARILVGGTEQARLRLSGTTRPFSQQVMLGPGVNRIVIVVDDLEGNTGIAERMVTTRGRPTKITSLTATPNPPRPGQTVELRWEIDAVGPYTLSLQGFGEVEGDSLVVLPDHAERYVFTATNEWGSDTAEILVTVKPELIPHVQVVAAGSVQKLRVAGLKAPGAFTVTGGTISRPEKKFDWIWEVPEEPGTYEVQVEHADGVWSHPVEVQAIEPLTPRVVGVGGHPAAEDSGEGSLVLDPEGRTWALTTGGVIRGKGDAWQLLSAGLEAQPLSLLLLPDGRPLARQPYRPAFGEGEHPYVVWEESSQRWIPWDDLPPIVPEGALVVGAAGWQVFREGSANSFPRALWRRAPDGTWTRLEGPAASQLALADDGTLYVAYQDRWGDDPAELWVAPPEAQALEPTGLLFPALPHALHVQPDGKLRAVGRDLWLVDPVAGTVDEEFTGLGCSPPHCVFSLVWVGDRLFSLHTWNGVLYEHTAEGWVVLVDRGDMPQAPTAMLPDGEGGLLVAGDGGLFHMAAGSTSLRPYVEDGLFGTVRISSAALAPDGTVALAIRPRYAPAPLLAFRPAGETTWTGTRPDFAGLPPMVRGLAFDGASRLSWLWSGALMRLPAGTPTWDEAEELPPPLPPPGEPRLWTALQDGSLVAAVGDEEIHRLPLDAAEWEEMPGVLEPSSLSQGPDGALWTVGGDGMPRRLEPGATDWEPVAPLAFDTPWSHRGTTVSFGPDGTPWTIAQLQGVQRLEDGLWRPVGSGTCSMEATKLVVTSTGAVVCATSDRIQALRTIGGAEVWVDVASFVPGKEVALLFEGAEGRVWLAFDRGGPWELHLP